MVLCRPKMNVAAPHRQLSLFDSTSLIVGIIIGAGIYQMAPDIARGAGSAWGVIGIWVAGGLLSLCGALSYAELATAFPQEGGDYVYLTRAYGRWAGFLFGWVQLLVVRPGDIAVMAFAFASYARSIVDWSDGAEGGHVQQVYAVAAIAILTLINVVGVKAGKWTQNLLTVIKALGLLAIVGLAFFSSPRPAAAASAPPFPSNVALILVLFTFGGWNEMAYVAAEVRDPNKNIIRALVVGMAAVTALYLMLNGAFLYALGYVGLATSQAVASDAIAAAFPVIGGKLISALVCVSALGAVNGLIFTGARISYAVGADHRAFAALGRWSQRGGTPARALLAQGALSIVLIVALGSFVDTILYTAAAVYSFYLATSLAVVVLRKKEPETPRPYRVLAYPLPILIFCLVCVFLIYGAVTYKPAIALAALGVILLGLPVYALSQKLASKSPG